MFNTLEGVIVNSELPSQYKQTLLSKQEFEKTVSKESFKEYKPLSSRLISQAQNNSN